MKSQISGMMGKVFAILLSSDDLFECVPSFEAKCLSVVKLRSFECLPVEMRTF